MLGFGAYSIYRVTVRSFGLVAVCSGVFAW